MVGLIFYHCACLNKYFSFCLVTETRQFDVETKNTRVIVRLVTTVENENVEVSNVFCQY